jgi:hypothetical protein
MATVDIELPGASEAALKAAIQALVPISTTTISSPVNYVDITLPSGYSAFQLVGLNFAYTGNTAIFMGAFSQNGGSSWIEDVDTTSNDYTGTIGKQEGFNATTDTVESGVLDIGLLYLVDVTNFQMTICPGSASVRPTAFAQYWSNGTTVDDGFATGRHVCSGASARVNALRILPYSVGNPSTPEPGDTIAAGAILSLYGVL